MMLDLPNVTKTIYDRAHVAGQDVKLDLVNWIERVFDDGTWKISRHPITGKPFKSIGEWLVAVFPHGPALGSTKYAITYDEMITLAEGRPKVKELLIRYRPTKAKGGNGSNQHKKKDAGANDSNRTVCLSRTKPGTSRLYIEQRLERDFPDVWKDYLGGKYKSARQAGMAAGFIADGHDPMKRVKSYWNKLSKKQRKEFLAWAANE